MRYQASINRGPLLRKPWYSTIQAKFQFGYGYVKLDRFNMIGYIHMVQMIFAVLIG